MKKHSLSDGVMARARKGLSTEGVTAILHNGEPVHFTATTAAAVKADDVKKRLALAKKRSTAEFPDDVDDEPADEPIDDEDDETEEPPDDAGDVDDDDDTDDETDDDDDDDNEEGDSAMKTKSKKTDKVTMDKKQVSYMQCVGIDPNLTQEQLEAKRDAAKAEALQSAHKSPTRAR